MQTGSHSGLFSWFAANPVAANLLMLCLLLGGLFIARGTPIETFPEIDPRSIVISVALPGASPEDIAKSINLQLEAALTGLEGIRRISSSASEGSGHVIAKLDDHSDKYETLDRIQSAVDRIPAFPPRDVEDVNIRIVKDPQPVIVVALYGDVSERNLREFAYDVRDDLTLLDAISIAKVFGVRDYEIAIEVDEAILRQYGLSFSEIADAVRAFSVNIPSGKLHTSQGEILLRTNQQAYTQADFEQILLRTQPNGSQIHLKDVAQISDGFTTSEAYSLFNGQPAAYITVERRGDQQVLAIEQAVKDHINQIALPEGIQITTWFNSASDLRSRIELLVNNGLLGLVMVFAVLVLFLNLKLAFWTTVGIPIAFLGAFFIINPGGGSINMISLFAFIVVLGLVVDDAIIVGESIFARREQGLAPMQAALTGLMDVISPVTIGVLTTIMAFLPLLFTTGFLGQVLSVVPLVVISVLLMSLVEAFLILPSHLSTLSLAPQKGPIYALQSRLRQGLQHIIDHHYTPALVHALKAPYVVVALAITSLLLLLGAMSGGHIKTVFFPAISGNEIMASVALPNGSSTHSTQAIIQHLLDTAQETQDEYDQQTPDGAPPVVRSLSASVGDLPLTRLRNSGVTVTNPASRSHRGEVVVELLPSEARDFDADEFERRWRERVNVPEGVGVYFFNNLLGAGSDISVALYHDNEQNLLLAIERLKSILAQYPGVVDIEDTSARGKNEFQFTLTPSGVAAGLTLNTLARQVRQAYQGEIAQRIQRGRDDIQVLVRYAHSERHNLDSLYSLPIRLNDGTEVPLRTVAHITEHQSAAGIRRANGKRLIEVDAEVIDEIANANEINAQLANQVLPDLMREFPGLSFGFEGAQRERQQSFNSLLSAMAISVLSIFALLAIQLRSYSQPLIIMSVIPIGLVGAILGHLLLGFPVSFLSFFGIVALSGVVINDSLILMDMINRLHREEGMALRQAIINGAKRRFRPIVFTSLTTCIGLAPIIAEKSTQAQFLIPMAISLAAGVLFATLITLFLVPALYLIRAQLSNLMSAKSHTADHA